MKKHLSNLKWSKWHCICKVWEKDKAFNEIIEATKIVLEELNNI